MPRRNEITPLVSQVGARIRFLRLERGLSSAKLAQRAGLWPSHLEGIELGRTAPNIITIRAIADGLRVSAFDLLNCDPTDARGEFVEMMRHCNAPTARQIGDVVQDYIKRRARASVPPVAKTGPQIPRTSAPPAA